MDHFQEFQELVRDFQPAGVDFLLVYIREAHPVDGWNLFKKGYQLRQHRELEDRLTAAMNLQALGSPCPLALDHMDDRLTYRLRALPERLTLLHRGRVVWQGGIGPKNYSIKEARKYLDLTLKANQ